MIALVWSITSNLEWQSDFSITKIKLSSWQYSGIIFHWEITLPFSVQDLKWGVSRVWQFHKGGSCFSQKIFIGTFYKDMNSWEFRSCQIFLINNKSSRKCNLKNEMNYPIFRSMVIRFTLRFYFFYIDHAWRLQKRYLLHLSYKFSIKVYCFLKNLTLHSYLVSSVKLGSELN